MTLPRDNFRLPKPKTARPEFPPKGQGHSKQCMCICCTGTNPRYLKRAVIKK